MTICHVLIKGHFYNRGHFFEGPYDKGLFLKDISSKDENLEDIFSKDRNSETFRKGDFLKDICDGYRLDCGPDYIESKGVFGDLIMIFVISTL